MRKPKRHPSPTVWASAIGYSLYLSLELIWRIQPSLSVAAIYVLSNLTIQIASGLFIAVGIAESYFSDALPPVLPINVLIAALFAGLVTPLTTGLMSGPLGTAGNSDRPLLALVFLMVAMSVSIGLAYFSCNRMSERREREAYLGSRDSDEFETGRAIAVTVTPRQRWSMIFSFMLLAFGLALGVNLRDNSISQSRIYDNVEAGITARYPIRWLLDESGPQVFRVRDMSQRGFKTVIEPEHATGRSGHCGRESAR